MTNHMCKYGRIRRINTAYTSIKPYSAYQLSPYRIRYGDVKFRRIRRINTIYNTDLCLLQIALGTLLTVKATILGRPLILR
jgi:hypothetical protein